MGIEDHQFNAAQPAPSQAAQELGPERLGFRGASGDAEDFTYAAGVDGHRDYYGDPQVGLVALDGALQECLHAFVDLLTHLFQRDQNTRFPLSYRSSISHTLKCGAMWDFNVTSNPVVNMIIAANSNQTDSAVLLNTRTPESVSINGFRQLDAR